MHDLVIRDALILDGLGGDAWRGDLAVAEGRIQAIGEVGPGRQEIDAQSLTLAPGFIDTHAP